jgi:hypothetical protein
MAAALLVTRPGLLAGAILLRPLSPFRGDLPTRLDGVPVLIIDGEKDSRRSPGDGARLADRPTNLRWRRGYPSRAGGWPLDYRDGSGNRKGAATSLNQ